MGRVALIVGLAVAAPGCFSPALPQVSCAETDQCPPEQTCDPVDFICRAPNPRADAALAVDAAAIDAVAGCVDWPSEPLHFQSCFVGTPHEPIDFSQFTPRVAVYDTTTGVLAGAGPGGMIQLSPFIVPQADGPDLAVLLFDSFELPAGTSLFAVGDRPLVIASNSTLAVQGSLFANGALNEPGPGTQDTAHCSDVDAIERRTGGGGGGFGSAGGGGGEGGGFQGGPPGSSVPVSATIYAGCPGGLGLDDNDLANPLGAPGAGGGAIQLTARDVITIGAAARIGAGGGGGSGGISDRHGGFGGGSGGFIGLDAPQIVAAPGAQLFANGGGGGEASGGGNQGNAGESATGPATAAGGFGGAGSGGDGGAGGSALSTAAPGVNDTSGGGGGGGAGRVIYRGFLDGDGALFTPVPIPFP